MLPGAEAAAAAASTEILKADAPASAPAAGTAAGTAAARPARPRRLAHRRVLVLVVSGLTLIALAVVALFLINPAEAPAVAPPNYPTVDGTLGTHLQELQESVNP
ncbi:hypothetical protein [Cryobacterium sp. Hh11]|uniref:hypothetical protein n=1 Tax=Cryobacterium sp. Hh11 TaxID=2555868 RepID=UPI001F53F315|nr:hypothetical protein [Cryobacterium sp. Hh11]